MRFNQVRSKLQRISIYENVAFCNSKLESHNCKFSVHRNCKLKTLNLLRRSLHNPPLCSTTMGCSLFRAAPVYRPTVVYIFSQGGCSGGGTDSCGPIQFPTASQDNSLLAFVPFLKYQEGLENVNKLLNSCRYSFWVSWKQAGPMLFLALLLFLTLLFATEERQYCRADICEAHAGPDGRGRFQTAWTKEGNCCEYYCCGDHGGAEEIPVTSAGSLRSLLSGVKIGL